MKLFERLDLWARIDRCFAHLPHAGGYTHGVMMRNAPRHYSDNFSLGVPAALKSAEGPAWTGPLVGITRDNATVEQGRRVTR